MGHENLTATFSTSGVRAGDEILEVNDIGVQEVENAVEDLREALKGKVTFVVIPVHFFWRVRRVVGTPFNGLYEVAPPKTGTFYRL